MATDRTILKSAQKGHVGSVGLSDPEGAVHEAHRRSYTFQITDGGTAGTDAAEAGVAMPVACKVVAVYLTAPIAVAGHASNNKTITVSKRVAGSATAIAAYTLTVANALTAFVPVSVTGTNGTFTASAAALAAGDALTVKTVVAASGIAIASSTAFFTVTVVVEEI